MHYKQHVKILLVVATFVLLLSACASTASKATDDVVTKKITTLQNETTTASGVVSTTSTATQSTASLLSKTNATTTSTVRTNPVVTTTTTKDINVLPSVTKKPPETQKISDEVYFSYDSVNYEQLRRAICTKYPDEKNLDEFRVVKSEKGGSLSGGVSYAYYVNFTRWINGCSTDAYYTLYFDSSDKLIAIQARRTDYNPAKVVPPRVATESEIAAAKKEEAAKVPDGCVVWKQNVSNSFYDIERDSNTFQVTTLYVGQMIYDLYLVESGAHYGQEPPHAAYVQSYVIPR